MEFTENETIKVLQFVRVLDRGGIESFILNNLAEMDLKLFQMDFLLTRNQMEAYDDVVASLGCNKVILEMKYEKVQFIKHLERFFKLYRFFKKSDYDIVHFHSVGPYLLSSVSILAAKLGGVPCRIVHSHLSKLDSQIYGMQKLKRFVGCNLNAKWGTCFLSCSDNAAAYAFPKKLINDNKVIHIKNAVNFSEFYYDEQVRKIWRLKLGLDDKYVLGCVARFARFKNHKFMVQVLEAVLKKKENVVLFLVGGEIANEPNVKKELEDYIKDRGLEKQVIFYGEADNVMELINAMDVFLMPSFYEGYPIAGIEAQCTGVQILASDHITESLKVTDNCHFLSIKDSIENWANAVIECNQGYERKDMQQCVREKGYDVKDTAMQLQDLYIKMVERI